MSMQSCVLCGRHEHLSVERCRITGESFAICLDALSCLERHQGPEGKAFRVAQLLAAYREGRRPPPPR